jgi:hyaluronoglucosaminidase
MFSKLTSFFDKDKFEFINEEDSLKLSVDFDSNIKTDGFILDVRQKAISIQVSDNRGLLYAIDTLNNLAKKSDEGFEIPIILIEDEPSFTHRGIIEGFYGTPWSFEERIDMIDFMRHNRLNTYIYAPKTDEYHRAKWCDLYPEDLLTEITLVFDKAKENHIDFFYTISPGYIKEGEYAFDYLNELDFQRLFRKLDQFIDLGITSYGLLLDDIDYQLTDKQKTIFSRPGIAHAYICNRMNEYLKEKIKNYQMVMCPTEYHQIGESRYRQDLKENLDKNIKVFFTGDNVCAEAITKSDIEMTRKAFGNDLFIWDNFPVSDFTYGVREYLAPIRNRYSKISDYASGYFINPSLHYHISKIGMQTMAEYAWNSEGYNPDNAFERALREIDEVFYKEGKNFVEFVYPSVVSYGKLHEYNQLVIKKDYQSIIKLYDGLKKSAEELLDLNLKIIEELEPWLKHAIAEDEMVRKLIHGNVSKEELLIYLQDKHFLGMDLIDKLICESKLLSDKEYQDLVTKRRGVQWYRVFEEKRWKK